VVGPRLRRLWIRAAAGLLLGVGIVLLAVAFARLSGDVRDAAGEVCGSAWHYRPGHGTPSGGERSGAQILAQQTACRAAAKAPYESGARFGLAGGCIVIAGLVVALPLMRQTTS
jgi:hypothetical protein